MTREACMHHAETLEAGARELRASPWLIPMAVALEIAAAQWRAIGERMG